MDKKPSVFANKIDKDIGNNSKIYYSSKKEDRETILDVKKEKNVSQKIKEIFTSSNYVYKANVMITLRSGTVQKTIVGKNALHLITIDNELIPISEILDIKRV